MSPIKVKHDVPCFQCGGWSKIIRLHPDGSIAAIDHRDCPNPPPASAEPPMSLRPGEEFPNPERSAPPETVGGEPDRKAIRGIVLAAIGSKPVSPGFVDALTDRLVGAAPSMEGQGEVEARRWLVLSTTAAQLDGGSPEDRKVSKRMLAIIDDIESQIPLTPPVPESEPVAWVEPEFLERLSEAENGVEGFIWKCRGEESITVALFTHPPVRPVGEHAKRSGLDRERQGGTEDRGKLHSPTEPEGARDDE